MDKQVKLPNDDARCKGVGYDDGNGIKWREDCHKCARRLSIIDGATHWWMSPIEETDGECEYFYKTEE